MSVYVVRAFLKLRKLLVSNRGLARKLVALERSLVTMGLKMQQQFNEIYDAIRALTNQPAGKRRGIRFIADLREKS